MSDGMWDGPLDEPERDTLGRRTETASEHVLLGSAMRHPELIDELAEEFHPDDFGDDRHRWVWHAIDDLRQDIPQGEIGVVPVHHRLEAWRADGRMPVVPLTPGQLAEIYLSGVLGASVRYHAERVTEAAEAARMGDLGVFAKQIASAADFDPEEAVAAVQQKLDSVMRTGASGMPTRVGDLVDDALDRAVTPPTKENRVPTGLADLDSLTGGGFTPGRLVIIGARPGTGKTTLGSGFARAAAIKSGLPTLFTSLEMGSDEIMDGILSAEAQVPLHHITNGKTDGHGVRKLAGVRDSVAAAPLYVDDATHVSLPSLRGQVRHLVRTVGLRLVVVDYLQLMQAPKAESRQVAVAALSRGLKLMAKEFGIVVVVLSQLNRMSEQRADKRPTIADLRESGAIEQDADMVILIHRPDMHEPESPRAGEVDLIIDKHRRGQRTTITAAWQGHYARLADMAAGYDIPRAESGGGLDVASYDEDPEAA